MQSTISLICILVAAGVCYLSIAKESFLKWLAGLILIAGTIVYGYGFYEGGTQESFLALGIRSVMSSFEMFIGGNDLLEVREQAHEDATYMTIFSTVHILAIFISIAAAAAALGSRAKFMLKLIKESFLGKKKKTYVFFGATEPAFLLAKDIRMKKDQDARFVFVQMPRAKEESEDGHAIHGLISMFNYRRSILKRIREIGHDAHLAIANKSFSDFECPDFRYYDETANFGEKKSRDDYMNPNGFQKPFELFSAMGLKTLRRILLRRTCRDMQISMFFLNEDPEFNLYSLDVLSSDPYFKESSENNSEKSSEKTLEPSTIIPKVVVYCQARRDNINLLEEHRFLQKNKLEVHIVDAAYLSVFYLKNNIEHLPVSYVTHKDGKVTSAFNTLILGFGETGQECLRFLYEYGAFVDENGERSPFHCTVMDKCMDKIKGTYLMHAPALSSSPLISFEQMDANHPDFWNRMKELILEMNYVVISVGDDEENISLAINLYEFASRERSNQLDNFTIFVRSYNPSHERRLNNIAQHYNLKNDTSRDKSKYRQRIVVFGELDEIYTFDRISFEDENEERQGQVRDFYEVYRILAGGKDWDWEERHRKLLDPKLPSDMPLLFRYRKLYRMESQDYANWMHIKTKLELLGLPSDKDEHTAHQRAFLREMVEVLAKTCNFQGEKRFENPGCRKEVWDAIVSLSQTEHLRWMAAHEMMGYTYGNVKSEERDMKMKHDLMVPWANLSDQAKLYDALVLLTTLVTQFPELKRLTN